MVCYGLFECPYRAPQPALLTQSADCCYPLQIIVLLVHEGNQQFALTEPKGLRCYHSLEVLNCGATLGSRAFLGGANGNIYEVMIQAKSIELVRSKLS